MSLELTGDPALDKLFADAENLLVDQKLASRGEDTDLVSDEPVKVTPGAIQNSGIKEDSNGGVLVPVMSEDALANNEPPRGHVMKRISTPKGVSSSAFYTLLSNAYALYVTEGSYDNERLQKRTGFTPGIIAKTLGSPEFTTALRLRGVSPEATGLTREQELCIQVLTDPSDGRTLSKKLDSLKPHGVTYAKYRAWLKQPTFRAYVNSVTEDMLSNNQDALVQLERLAAEGDLAAIKYKFEMSGRHNPAQQQNIDMMALLSKVLEIVTAHVRDPETLRGVAEDMGALAQQLRSPQIGR